MSDDTKVKVVGLTKKFGDLLVLNDISFNVKKGDFVCIVGPTGCGKTTFLNLLVKLIEPTSGQILIDGEPGRPEETQYRLCFPGAICISMADCRRKSSVRPENKESRPENNRRENKRNCGILRTYRGSEILSTRTECFS